MHAQLSQRKLTSVTFAPSFSPLKLPFRRGGRERFSLSVLLSALPAPIRKTRGRHHRKYRRRRAKSVPRFFRAAQPPVAAASWADRAVFASTLQEECRSPRQLRLRPAHKRA